MDRNAHLKFLLGEDAHKQVNEMNILVVGAGGIGCELLKNLSLTGIVNMEVIDLDTIDITNLNRQFLFRRQHVGLPKSTIAAEAVLKFNPDVKIVPHLGNIKTDEFGVSYFQKFDFVFNALDNYKARQHVNRICLAAGVPLIEGGSTGWDCQVQVIIPGETECFECVGAPKTQSFPVCTIRSTPERPEHCVAWAKLVHDALFSSASGDEGKDIAPGLDWARQAVAEGRQGEFAHEVITSLFITSMEERIKTVTASEEAKQAKAPRVVDKETADKAYETAANGFKHAPEDYLSELSAPAAPAMTVEEAVQLVTKGVLGVLATYEAQKDTFDAANPKGVSSNFTKDDPYAVDFVAGAANLRAWCFEIEQASRFRLQSIAGAIVPAIASTNAIVAGGQTAEMVNVLMALRHPKVKPNTEANPGIYTANVPPKNLWSKPNAISLIDKVVASGCGHDWLHARRTKVASLSGEALNPPNRKTCFVCADSMVTCEVKDVSSLTLKSLVEDVLKSELGLNVPLVERDGAVLFDGYMTAEEAEEDGVDNGDKPLADLGLSNGAIFSISDDSQGDISVKVMIVEAKDLDLNIFPSGVKVNNTRTAEDAAAEAESATAEAGEKRERGLIGVDAALEAELDERQARKRGKMIPEVEEGVVIDVDDE